MTMSRLKIQVKQLERVITEKDIIIDEKEQNLLAVCFKPVAHKLLSDQ